jgi:2-keto-4-pentenoate hydratase/2-oxohepta-3-ene-1,7-dioic acid hydratase in catechol pathway
MTSARSAASRAKTRLPLAAIKYLPPVVAPPKAIAVGLNYVDHAAESPYKDAPKYPVLFHRFPQSWVAATRRRHCLMGRK